MKTQQLVIKLSCIGFFSFGLAACSMLPSGDGIFIDQKEEYKKAHELPLLEIPPTVLADGAKDEYDGGIKETQAVRSVAKIKSEDPVLPAKSATPVAPTKNAIVKVTPLPDDQPVVELKKKGINSSLLVRDSVRNTWRKTIGILEDLGYEIEDKNRQRGRIYLKVPIASGKSKGMLSGFSLWGKVDMAMYVVALEHQTNGVKIRVLSEEKGRVDDDVTRDIFYDLSSNLGQ